jgi:hypothetical protein
MDELWTFRRGIRIWAASLMRFFAGANSSSPGGRNDDLNLYEAKSVCDRTISIHPSGNHASAPVEPGVVRALPVDLSDTAGPVASITLKKRRTAGAVKLFVDESGTVCEDAF